MKKDEAVNNLKNRLEFEGIVYTDDDLYHWLRAEKFWQYGWFKKYRDELWERFTVWFHTHEPYNGDEVKCLWENGFTCAASCFNNVKEIKDYFNQ